MDRVVYRKRNHQSRGNGSSVNSLFNNTFTKLILITISVFFLYNVGHSIDITIQKVDILRRARIEVDSLRLKNLELALSLDDMQSVEYLEVQARDRLNFTGENEYVFVIPESVLDDTGVDLEKFLSTEEEVITEMGYDVWKEFFLNGI